jgi:alpha-D-ribose 1-methylphosphonate 5-triphosphate synthase subunit PhnG
MMSQLNQSDYLTILTHTPAPEVKKHAEAVLPHLDDIEVLRNRTGLVMLPYTDSAHGTLFHLGEVLVAEAHIRLKNGSEGYGMVLGRDYEFAMAVAVLDAALSAGVMVEYLTTWLAEQAREQAEQDRDLLRKVEATRVEMETF